MMRIQRYIILVSFIVAAILTPTPDPINQTIMALPAVILYQVSILLVWRINKKRKFVNQVAFTDIPEDLLADEVKSQPAVKQDLYPLSNEITDSSVTKTPIIVPRSPDSKNSKINDVIVRPKPVRPVIVRAAPVRSVGRFMDIVGQSVVV